MRNWVKITLFLSSFSPLFFIIFVQNIKFESFAKISGSPSLISTQLFQSNMIAIAMILLFIIPNFVLFLLMSRCMRYSPERKTIHQIAYKHSDVLNYIVSYLIPFLSFKTDKISDLLSFVILLGILAIVYINANMFYINPILIICGYNVYQINDSSVLITKEKPASGSLMNFYKVENNVYMGVRIGGGNS